MPSTFSIWCLSCSYPRDFTVQQSCQLNDETISNIIVLAKRGNGWSGGLGQAMFVPPEIGRFGLVSMTRCSRGWFHKS